MTVAFRPMRMDEIDLCADLWVETWSDTYPAIDFNARRGWFIERFKSCHDTFDADSL